MENNYMALFDRIMALKEEFVIAIDLINKAVTKDRENRESILETLKNSPKEDCSPIILDMIVERDTYMTEASIIYNELVVRYNCFMELETGMDFEPSFINVINEYNYLLARRNFNLLEGRFKERETGFVDKVKELRKREFVNDSYIEYLIKTLESEQGN